MDKSTVTHTLLVRRVLLHWSSWVQNLKHISWKCNCPQFQTKASAVLSPAWFTVDWTVNTLSTSRTMTHHSPQQAVSWSHRWMLNLQPPTSFFLNVFFPSQWKQAWNLNAESMSGRLHTKPRHPTKAMWHIYLPVLQQARWNRGGGLMWHLASTGHRRLCRGWSRACIQECPSVSWPRRPCTGPGGPLSAGCCWCSGRGLGRVCAWECRRSAWGCWCRLKRCQPGAGSL